VGVGAPVNVLLVGKGAREHAIAWKLKQSPLLRELYVAPGNAGTAAIAKNVPIPVTDVPALLKFAAENKIDFTIVGPEAPLALGVVDAFQKAGRSIFGPTKAAAQLETSKSFAKGVMLRSGVPTAQAKTFTDFAAARDYVAAVEPPIVVKADGLAEGKGVVVAETRDEATAALKQQMVDRQFGAAGEKVLIEEFLQGREVSVFGIVDGQSVSSLVAACDHKRVGDGDTGPNTGGMGTFSPPSRMLWNPEVADRVLKSVFRPVAKAMCDLGTPYRGILYAGIMMTGLGPKVYEFNARFGDPEAQVIIPRLKTDLLNVMISAAKGDLGNITLEWDPSPCVGVVVASGGYPGKYPTGFPITGLDKTDTDVMVFHAGTKPMPDGTVVTDGGRVLTVTAIGDSHEAARSKAYDNARRISFTGNFYRNDIAAKV